MKVSLWAEARRLHEVEQLSQRAIARRLRCSPKTVRKALTLEQPPSQVARPRRKSKLDPFRPRIDQLLERYPQLSAVRALEEISKGAAGYRGGITVVRDYLRTIRPARGRVYQEVFYDPGEAVQVDWGECGRLKIGGTWRRVSVLVAVFCYSRLCYIEFSLSERKADFYRCVVHAGVFRRLPAQDHLRQPESRGQQRLVPLSPSVGRKLLRRQKCWRMHSSYAGLRPGPDGEVRWWPRVERTRVKRALAQPWTTLSATEPREIAARRYHLCPAVNVYRNGPSTGGARAGKLAQRLNIDRWIPPGVGLATRFCRDEADGSWLAGRRAYRGG